MIKAFLFDVDGVLADTIPVSISLTKAYYASKGYNISEECIRGHLGVGMKELLLGPGRDNNITLDYEEGMVFFKERYKDELLSRNPSLPGGAELIKRAKKCGVLLAVASSAPRWRVETNLSAIGVDPSDMDLIISGGDIKRNKPFGDIYSLALINFGLDGKEAIVFEDAFGGIKSGKNAGAFVCALETTITREEAKKAGADTVIKDLSFFPEFNSLEELDTAFKKMRHIGKGAKKYGKNWITPLERQMPKEFLEKKAIDEALSALYNAYAPYSKFRVGASVLSSQSGRIYAGCNVENASYGATICAERNAITTAITNEGVIGIDLLVVASESKEPAPPCAVCLQVMSEFIRPETPIILVSTNGAIKRMEFKDLLPSPFSFEED